MPQKNRGELKTLSHHRGLDSGGCADMSRNILKIGATDFAPWRLEVSERNRDPKVKGFEEMATGFGLRGYELFIE